MVVPEDGLVYHDAELIPMVTFFALGGDEQVVMLIVDEGNFYILFPQVYGSVISVVDLVFYKTAAFYFPAIIDVPAAR